VVLEQANEILRPIIGEDVGGPVYSHHMDIIGGDLRTYRADLKGIITGGVGNFAFVTRLERIRAEANVDIVTSQ
ncbi:2076_t:CDS:2, partial [Racocetra fulgida]